MRTFKQICPFFRYYMDLCFLNLSCCFLNIPLLVIKLPVIGGGEALTQVSKALLLHHTKTLTGTKHSNSVLGKRSAAGRQQAISITSFLFTACLFEAQLPQFWFSLKCVFNFPILEINYALKWGFFYLKNTAGIKSFWQTRQAKSLLPKSSFTCSLLCLPAAHDHSFMASVKCWKWTQVLGCTGFILFVAAQLHTWKMSDQEKYQQNMLVVVNGEMRGAWTSHRWRRAHKKVSVP